MSAWTRPIHHFAPRNARPMTLALAALLVAIGIGLMMAHPWIAEARTTAGDVDGAALHRALDHHALRTLDRKSLDARALRGDVVVLNFWASWCRPCRRELPALNALHAEIAPRGGRVIAVSIDEDPANVVLFAKANGLTLPIVADGPAGLARELDLQHVPMTVVLDRDGAVALTVSGGDDRAIQRIGAKARELVARSTQTSLSTGGTR